MSMTTSAFRLLPVQKGNRLLCISRENRCERGWLYRTSGKPDRVSGYPRRSKRSRSRSRRIILSVPCSHIRFSCSRANRSFSWRKASVSSRSFSHSSLVKKCLNSLKSVRSSWMSTG